jgi:hypothetical protein
MCAGSEGLSEGQRFALAGFWQDLFCVLVSGLEGEMGRRDGRGCHVD